MNYKDQLNRVCQSLSNAGFHNIKSNLSEEKLFIVADLTYVRLSIAFNYTPKKVECDIFPISNGVKFYNDMPAMSFNETNEIDRKLTGVLRIARTQNDYLGLRLNKEAENNTINDKKKVKSTRSYIIFDQEETRYH